MESYKDFNNVFFMDLGKNKVTLLHRDAKKVYSLNANDLFDFMLNQPEGTLWIGEAAHFGTPQNEDIKKLSKAQYWKENELLQLYEELEDAGHSLRFFPQKSTSKYRVWHWDKIVTFAKDNIGVDIEKKKNIGKDFDEIPGKANPKKCLEIKRDDMVDCITQWFALEYRPHIFHSFKRPSGFNCQRRLEGMAMKEDMNGDKRFIKQFDYSHPEDEISKYLCSIVPTLYYHFNDVQRDIFNLPKRSASRGTLNSYKDGVLIDSWIGDKLSMLTSITLPIMDASGNIRIRPSTGKMAGWKFTKDHLLKLHALHMFGGICRADIMYNRFPSWVAAKLDNKIKNANDRTVKKQLKDYTAEEVELWYEWRNIYTKNLHSAFSIIKNVILGEIKTMTIDELNEILKEEHRIAKKQEKNQKTIEFSS